MSILSILGSAFWSSDTVGKLVLLAIFPVLSAVLWGILMRKFMALGEKRNQDKEVQTRLDKMKSHPAHQILGELEQNQALKGNLAELGRAAAQTLLEILKFTPQQRYLFFSEGILPRSLTGEEVDRVMVAMENQLCKLERELDEGLHSIASVVTIAPLLGLFGTVWGVMATFMGIVENGGRPDIQAIAPGISGALLTTVAGLFVAIPGTWFNNALLKRVQDRKRDMEEFCSLICASLSVAKPAPREVKASSPSGNVSVSQQEETSDVEA